MRSRARAAVWLVLIHAAALLVSCGSDRHRACASSDDCPPDAFCDEGACRADTPPTAAIQAPSPITTNRRLAFDGSGSSDPDPGDAVVAWSWSVASLGGGCDPIPRSGTGHVFETVFGCPGPFEVQLVARDRFGLESAPATLAITVGLMPDPPTVTTGPPLALEHQCSGSPLVCSAVDAQGGRTFRLEAAAAGPAPGGFTYRWSYAAPAGADPNARVAFVPGSDDPSPAVSIETDGTGIAGTWRFAVEATDSRGAAAAAEVEVTVGNRPPVVVPGDGEIHVAHGFDAAKSRFVAHGATAAVAILDPDGDPIVGRIFTSSSSGDGGSPFLVTPFADHAEFDISVGYASPKDVALLIGPDVKRSIEFSATDVNGGIGKATWSVLVENRPPRVSAPVASLSVPHRFDTARSEYFAAAALSTFVDDDGDPMVLDPATGDARCVAESMPVGTANVRCRTPYVPGVLSVGALLGAYHLVVTAADPWSATSAATDLTVENTFPRFTGKRMTIATACVKGECCIGTWPNCTGWIQGTASGTGFVATPVVDDDGDPIELSYGSVDACATVISATSYTCPSADCPQVQVSLCATLPSCLLRLPASGTITVAFSDGIVSDWAFFDVTGTACP